MNPQQIRSPANLVRSCENLGPPLEYANKTRKTSSPSGPTLSLGGCHSKAGFILPNEPHGIRIFILIPAVDHLECHHDSCIFYVIILLAGSSVFSVSWGQRGRVRGKIGLGRARRWVLHVGDLLHGVECVDVGLERGWGPGHGLDGRGQRAVVGMARRHLWGLFRLTRHAPHERPHVTQATPILSSLVCIPLSPVCRVSCLSSVLSCFCLSSVLYLSRPSLSVCLSVHPSVCLSVSLSVCPCLCLQCNEKRESGGTDVATTTWTQS